MNPLIAILMVLVRTAPALIDERDFPSHRIIEKEVAILGGGGSGAFAAVRLREDYEASIIVIEKDVELGGHANTYYDVPSQTAINYGVQVYTPYGPVEDFFARFNVEMVPATAQQDKITSTVAVDVATGELLSAYRPPSLNETAAAAQKWLAVAKKYEPYMKPGYWNFFTPGTIPDELLLRLDVFARQYNIETLAPSMALINNIGVGSFGSASAWQIMAFQFGAPVVQALVDNSFIVPKGESNQYLYNKIYDLLQDDVMLNSQVVAAERSHNGVKLVVQSNDGTETLVKAKKLLVSYEPSLPGLAPLDLDDQELHFFETFTPTWLFGGILRIPFIPKYTTVEYIASHAVPDNYLSIRDFPYSVTILPRGPPERKLFQVELTTNYSITNDDARKLMREKVLQLVDGGAFNISADFDPAEVEDLAFVDHNSVLWRQSPEVAQGGIVQESLALQGHRCTWYTGSLWSSDYSSDVWAFTDSLLPRVMGFEA